tara:strand:- start:5529 stop:8312 length:2784 start_codon:yes stop_codon:yes gene_type:complete
MSIERVFLGTGRHCLHAVVDHLQERFAPDEGRWDLAGLLLLLPGSRAGRRLRALLRQRAEERRLHLVPPDITTIGRLADRMLVPRYETATPLAERLAWIAAIRSADRPVQDRLLGRSRADDGSYPEEAIEALADTLASVSSEIAGADTDFHGIADHEFMQGNPDALRWRDLSTLQSQHDERLREHGFERRDARAREFLAGDGEAVVPLHVGFISADLNAVQRRLIDAIVDRGGSVFALIHASADDTSSFDEHGCVVPDAWCGRNIEIGDSIRHVGDGPADQIGCIVDLLGSIGPFDPDDVSVGLPDESLLPVCRRVLPEWGVPVHEPIGVRMDRTRIGRMLKLLERFLERGEASDFAALLREPIVEHWMRSGDGGTTELLEAFDRYREDCLPMHLESRLPDRHASLARTIRPSFNNLEALRDLDDEPRIVVDHLERLLLELVAPSTEDIRVEDRTVLKEVGSILDSVQRLGSLIGRCSPAVLLRLVVGELAQRTVTESRTESAVDLLGWLECHLDDADTLLVAGCNEGLLPMSLNADPFLPNELRRAIGLVDNERRLARDAYLLEATLRSGRTVHLVSGRRGIDGEAQIPSRLLLTGDAARIASNVLDFTGASERFRIEAPARGDGEGVVRCPDPGRLAPLDSMSVTAFRDYITCPYRFMLKHVLRLNCRDDEPDELTALSFGSLAHDVLEAFGRSEIEAGEATVDARRIRDRLDDLLDHESGRRFGSSLLPAVRLQLDQLRWRLRHFADHQARQARAGWRIVAVELSFGPDSSRAPCDHPSVPFPTRESMLIRGRIDRIDVHEDGGIRILDYKTGNKTKKPVELHRRHGEWIDLQLPLYRHLVRAAGFDLANASLGYVALPARTDDHVFSLAPWDDEDYATADVRAVEIIDAVRSGRFEPSPDAPLFHDDWSRICGSAAIELEDRE